MPLPTAGGRTNYKPAKDKTVRWDTFRRGLNTLLRETELRADELTQADNLMLVGSGVPTKRWGSSNYFLAGATGTVRGLSGYYNGATNELLALTDWGFLTKKSGTSYTMITGGSWVSGYDARMAQLNNNVYIVNGTDLFKKYTGSTITTFTALSVPTGLAATNLSGVSGTFTYSWRVSAENTVGETLASNAITLGNLPQDMTTTSVLVSWTTASPASGVKGYVVYGRERGLETFLGRTDSSSLKFTDDGTAVPATLAQPPTADSTSGPIAKYILKNDNRLILAGVSGQASRVMFTGKSQNAEKFHWSQGGGYIDIDVDSGDTITNLDVFQNKVIVYKEKSIWQLTIGSVAIGNYTVALPVAELITASHGCISGKTVAPVENDSFFLTRNGIYVLGYEPNILNVLRTNEISAKIRPFFESLTYSDLQSASASYIDKKYILSFPTVKKTIIYDRERTAWMGPWITPFGINGWYKYYDSAGAEKWLAADTSDTYTTEFSTSFKDDKGAAFTTILRSKKEDFQDWSSFKTIKDIFLNLKSVKGDITVNLKIEERDGSVTTASSFTITSASSNAGWGSSQWGDSQWGDSEEHGSAVDVNDLVRQVLLNKTARSFQIEIKTSAGNDNYELLGAIINARPQSKGATPRSWRV